MRTRKSVVNILFSFLSRLVTVLSGFVVARYLLLEYGSSVNGMLSSSRQFLNYLKLFELGIAGSVVFALFKPISEQNNKRISEVLTLAKKYYIRSGFLFSVSSILLAVVYALLIKDESIERITAFLVFIILSLNVASDFFFFSKFKVLFIADQKEYIISLCNVVFTLAYAGVALFAIFNSFNIVMMQLVILIAYAIRSALLFTLFRKYYKKEYSFSSTLNELSPILNHRKSVIVHEVSWLVLASLPIVAITTTFSLKQVSVYAVHNMVLYNVILVVSVFNSAFTSSFGDVLARKQYKTFNLGYIEFEYFFFMLSGWVYATTAVLIVPFIKLYTFGITDIDYYNPMLVGFMVCMSVFNSIRVPSSVMVNSAGAFKKTQSIAVWSAIACIVLTFMFLQFSMEMALIGSIVGYIIRYIGHITKGSVGILGFSIKKSIEKSVLLIVLVIISVILNLLIFNSTSPGYLHWLKMAVWVALINGVIFTGGFVLYNRSLFSRVLHRIKMVIPARHD